MDDVIKLIQARSPVRDANGNIKYTEQKAERFCKVRSATRREFYAAETQDIKPELIITISHKIDYNGERELEYNGERWIVDDADPHKDWNGVILSIHRNLGNSGPRTEPAEVG